MTVEAILSRLRRTEIQHPHYALAYSRLYSHTVMALPGSLVVLVGPSRVGKTTLANKLERELLGGKESQKTSPYTIVRIDAATTDQGFISTKYLTHRFLVALEHPFYLETGYRARFSGSESTMRAHLLAALKARKTQYLIVDEAHHLLREKSSRAINAALDSLKCLGNEAQVVIILLGGYELLASCLASAHLNGRLTLIDFPNYTLVGGDLREFDRLLASIDRLLPWAKGKSLMELRDLIYSGSLGCYGALMQWITAALSEMTAQGDQRLRQRHFQLTRFKEQLLPIRREIALAAELLHPIGHTDEDANIPSSCALSASVKGRRRLRPFTRRPKRDAVKRPGD